MSSASAQSSAALRLDPSTPGQGTTLLVGLDDAALASGGRAPSSMTIVLPRGMRLDTRARTRLCSRAQATAGRCPAASKVGFGRLVQSVTGYLASGGETELAWTITVFLATPERAGDVTSLVLRAELLGADRVDQLLTPALGVAVAHSSLVSGRVVREGSRLQARFTQLPGALTPPPPAVVTPTRFELAIGAVRRVREDFVRHVRVRTVNGYRTQQIPDHRLVGHDLLGSPRSCGGTWPAELRLGFPSGMRRTAVAIPCLEDSAS